MRIVLKSIVVFATLSIIKACSNLIVSPQASADGSAMVAYNADSGTLYGSLYHYPAADHGPGAMRDVFDWDTGNYLGQIPEASHTFNVVGNMNEFGLVIGETTFGGIEALQSQPAAKVDYGSLIWITLQRAKTAREAIDTIASLVATYGYASEGESFSIADPKEAWILEIIGKGEYELGAVWVARKVPAGHITAHANQARIRTFPLNSPEDTVYAPDVISFARKIGIYPTHKLDEHFSFSDVYDPVNFEGARFCEARVWSIFSTLLGDAFSQQYLDYAQGYNLTNRMPLFIKPAQRLSVQQVMDLMRSHYEGSALDMSGQTFSDVGAYTESIYRVHPLTWTSTVTPSGDEAVNPLDYFNERPIATPQTGWNFVAQARAHVPIELSGLLWFGVDDSGTTVRTPVYASATAVPKAFAGKGPQDGVVPPMMKFDLQSAFYVFNLVANWAYTRWDLMYPDILSTIKQIEQQLQDQVEEVDRVALALYRSQGPSQAVEYVTKFGVHSGDALVKRWFEFFGDLFVKYRDGYVITADSSSKACGCDANGAGYPQSWYDRIVRDTGSHYAVPQEEERKGVRESRSVRKSKLLALR
eukprot:gene3651-3997_t